MGSYSGGKYNLVVSFQFHASPDLLDLWRECFKRASDLLYTATLGQHQLGTIYYANDGGPLPGADALIHGTVVGNNCGGRVWDSLSFQLDADASTSPFAIVHELGHYLYDLGDEYKTPTSGSAVCIGKLNEVYLVSHPDQRPTACIMERGMDDGGDKITVAGGTFTLVAGDIVNFCHADTHDLAGVGYPFLIEKHANDTVQSVRHAKSCWSTIESIAADIAAPIAAPTSGARLFADPIGWVELLNERRFALILDRSASMGLHAGGPLTGAVTGGMFWADSAVAGDRLGAVAFNEGQAQIGLVPIATDADRAAVADFVGALTATGSTGIGSALEVGATLIRPPGDSQARTQSMLLLSDGVSNTGPDPVTVLPDLIAAGIRVYTIGLGPTADLPLLTAIAEQTGGSFAYVDTSGDPVDVQDQIEDALILASAELRASGGVVTAEAVTMGVAPPASASADSFSDLLADGKLGVGEHPTFIEAGVTTATFVVKGRQGANLGLELVRPDGSIIGLTTPMSADVRYVQRSERYTFVQVSSPTPGIWWLRIRSADQDGPAVGVRYRYYVLVESRSVAVQTDSERRQRTARAGDDLRVVARVAATAAATKLRMRAEVIRPNGEVEELSPPSDSGRVGQRVVDAPGSGRYVVAVRLDRPGVHRVRIVVDNLRGDGALAAEDCTSPRPKRGRPRRSRRVARFLRQATIDLVAG